MILDKIVMKGTPSKVLGVGIIGCGLIGQKRANALGSGGKLIACADSAIDKATVLANRFNAKSFNDWRDLIAMNEIDIVIISTLHDSLAEITLAAVNFGKNVLVEKPAARTSAELEPILLALQKNNAKVHVGFNHRYHESVRKALRIIGSGELGKIINIRGVYGKSKIIRFDSDWRTKRAMAGGGIFLDQGIHMVDLMRYFTGEFVEIHSFISNAFWNHDVEDNAYALMRTKDGVVAMLHSSATQWRHSFNLSITLTKGALILSGILSGSKSYGAETITVVHAKDKDAGDPFEEMTRYNEDNSWRDEVFDFARAIVENKKIKSGTSLEALETMKTVYRIYHADPAWRQKFAIPDPDRGGL